MAPVLWAMNGLEVSTAVVLAYAIGVGLLLVSGGLWWNRRLTMNRAYAEAMQRHRKQQLPAAQAKGSETSFEAVPGASGGQQGIPDISS